MTGGFANDEQDWVTQQLSDPEVRKGFNQERAVREFQDQLQSVLERGGLTRKDLADRLGKSGAFVSQCMRKGHNLTIATMSELASACGFELHVLLRRQHAVGAGAIFSEADWCSWDTGLRAKAVHGPHASSQSSGEVHVVSWPTEASVRSSPECHDWPRNAAADTYAAAFPCHQIGLNA